MLVVEKRGWGWWGWWAAWALRLKAGLTLPPLRPALQYVDLRTRYSELTTLTSQYIRFISDALRRLEEEEVRPAGGGVPSSCPPPPPQMPPLGTWLRPLPSRLVPSAPCPAARPAPPWPGAALLSLRWLALPLSPLLARAPDQASSWLSCVFLLGIPCGLGLAPCSGRAGEY